MERFVTWWCDFIGITDPYAIQIATGVLGGGSALLVALALWTIFLAFGTAITTK
jgi:hypothetical protein